MKQPAVYMMASRRNGTLYTGVTSNFPQRTFQHREGLIAGFTRRYGCKVLVWYEVHDTMATAIAREKQIKGGSRGKKLALIETHNPDWRDLFDEIARTAHSSQALAHVIASRRRSNPGAEPHPPGMAGLLRRCAPRNDGIAVCED